MTLTSFNFLLFFAVILIVYYIFPKRFQWVLLLVASYTFYIVSGFAQVFFLIGTTLVTYFSALIMQKRRNRYTAEIAANKDLGKEEKQEIKKRANTYIHRVQVIAVLIDRAVLAVVKYSSFVIGNLNSVIHKIGFSATIPGLKILVPLGISFYTFMSMGYIIDIGRGKYEAERNPGKLALFLSFFPSIIQGPISRFEDIGKKLTAPHKLNYENLTYGAQLIMWGFFKKLVIADRISPVVSGIFVVDYKKFSGSLLFLGVILYAIQIYCDFSGGIDITRGAAQMLGIELPLNFERPYFSKSVAEYWRRWHITLGAWMREYVFYPIMLSKPISKLSKRVKNRFGQQKAKYVPAVITPFVVFILIGIWHGANWKYVAFGLYNAIVVAGSVALSPLFKKITDKLKIKTESAGWKVFSIIRTFLILMLSKALVKSPSLKSAGGIIIRMFTNFRLNPFGELMEQEFSLDWKNYVVFGVALLLLFTVSVLQERGVKIRKTVGKWNIVPRWIVYYLMLLAILIFGIYGPAYDASAFIYQAY
ncbi:MAG: MBOAT family protein [Lachnospiraceae bacterium]|nr:MBOAT family protein [Lachnospiraceae bacterium]